MVEVQKMEILISGKVSKFDVAVACMEAGLILWRARKNDLHRAFNKRSMERAGIGRIH